MERFAKPTVAAAETQYKLARALWDESGEELDDDDEVVFYLTEQSDTGAWLYLADSHGQMCFHGTPDDVPREWLEEDQIRFYFKMTIEEFLVAYAARPG